jgi:hypothetical protein
MKVTKERALHLQWAGTGSKQPWQSRGKVGGGFRDLFAFSAVS